MSRLFWAIVFLFLSLYVGCAAAVEAVRGESAEAAKKRRPEPPYEGPAPLRVMSFNIRVPNPLDGANFWDNRKAAVVEVIKGFRPDVLATQEVYLNQALYLDNQLANFEYVGRTRDGAFIGEMVPIFYRADRFDKTDEGHFWLSETPGRVGSIGWDAQFPRMVTWLRLRRKSDGYVFYIFNTHFDHRGVKARAESAKLLRDRVTRIAGDRPAIITGDFNAGESSAAYRTLVITNRRQALRLGQDDEGPKFVDSYRVVNPRGAGGLATYHNFTGRRRGPRIDWILSTTDLQAVEADIVRKNDEGRYPSDHFPVTAVLRPR